MRWAAAAALVVLGACDALFGLDRVEIPPDGPRCEFEALNPDGDFDMDGMLNGVDGCPTVAYHDPNADEDGDLIPDGCDPCPQLATPAGMDADCDEIGVACDPDDTVAHERAFFGFNSLTGLDTSGEAVAVGGNLRVTYSAQTGGRAYVVGLGSADGLYEAAFEISNIDAEYAEVVLHFRDENDNNPYWVQLETNNMEWRLSIEDSAGLLAETSLGTLGTTVQFTLAVSIAGPIVTARATGSATSGLLTAALTVPLVPVEYGIKGYRVSDGHPFQMDVRYLQRITTR